MYVVAITRWGAPLEQDLGGLATALGEQAYDLRMKLAGGLPVYPYRGADRARAQQVLGVVQQRGHGAVAVGLEHVRSSTDMLSPRSVRVTEDALVLTQANEESSLPYVDILAVVHAMQVEALDATHSKVERKVSLGRAALTGGVSWSKSTTSKTNIQQEDAEQVLYLFRRTGTDPVLLRQNSLRLDGVDGFTGRTSLETLRATIDELRKRAPAALYDNRLLTNKRKPTALTHAVNVASTTTRQSNTSDNDLAAHVLALAHLKGQL